MTATIVTTHNLEVKPHFFSVQRSYIKQFLSITILLLYSMLYLQNIHSNLYVLYRKFEVQKPMKIMFDHAILNVTLINLFMFSLVNDVIKRLMLRVKVIVKVTPDAIFRFLKANKNFFLLMV